MNDEQPSGERISAEGWTPYAPLRGTVTATCSFCGRAQAADLRLVLNADGSAGICEECCASHAEFFARRRAREPN